jgi:hypothetical protein
MAGIVETLRESGASIPTIPTISGAGMQKILLYGGIALLFVFAGGLVVYFYYQKYKWNKIFVLWKKVGNQWQITNTDKGRFERVGNAGDYWAKWRSLKRTCSKPRKQWRKNEYWFAEGDDGEIREIDSFDFDKGLRQIQAHFVDEDMRLQRLGIQKNLASRFEKVGFWTKYGATIMMVIFVVITTICLVVLFKELKGLSAQLGESSKATEHMASSIDNMAQRIGIISGGGELVPATPGT